MSFFIGIICNDTDRKTEIGITNGKNNNETLLI